MAAYALTQISIWGTYGFLFTYANPYMTERLGLTDTLAGWLLCLATALACLLQPLLTEPGGTSAAFCSAAVF